MPDLRARAKHLITNEPDFALEVAKAWAEHAPAGLTSTQRKLYDFIKGQISCTGLAPNYDEMAWAMGGVSKSNIGRLVSSLQERGLITYRPRLARSIKITGNG